MCNIRVFFPSIHRLNSARTNCNHNQNFNTNLKDLVFADDITFFSTTLNDLDEKAHPLRTKAERLGMKLNHKAILRSKHTKSKDLKLITLYNEKEEDVFHMYILEQSLTKKENKVVTFRKQGGNTIS